MKSGWALGVLALLFLLAFFIQRSCSVVLEIEDDRPLAERIALKSGMTIPEVMALRELLGLDQTDEQLQRAAEQFSQLRTVRGDGLAILTVAGHEDLASELWEQSGRDPSRGKVLLRERPEAILAVRFESMTGRFARR